MALQLLGQIAQHLRWSSVQAATPVLNCRMANAVSRNVSAIMAMQQKAFVVETTAGIVNPVGTGITYTMGPATRISAIVKMVRELSGKTALLTAHRIALAVLMDTITEIPAALPRNAPAQTGLLLSGKPAHWMEWPSAALAKMGFVFKTTPGHVSFLSTKRASADRL
mmetsp:Transcript_41048/g.64877  ORF Transcript_41048/g.64877 Transcript_41048/m.64877 type:complete len:167 (-) Transcript_41048:89-589(-)